MRGPEEYGYGRQSPGYERGYGRWGRPRSRGMYGRPRLGPVETRPFFLTSDFLGTLVAIVAIAISAATIDVLDVRLTWILIASMISGYVLSRGIAKIGVRSNSVDPREELLRHAVDTGSASASPRASASGTDRGTVASRTTLRPAPAPLSK